MTRKSKGKPGVFFAVSLSFARALLAARRLEGVKGKADRVRIMRVIIRLAEWSLRRFNFRHELIVSGGGQFRPSRRHLFERDRDQPLFKVAACSNARGR